MKLNKAILKQQCNSLGNALKPENAELLARLEVYGNLFANEDKNGSGTIELLELQKCFVDIGNPKTRVELRRMPPSVGATGDELDYGHFAALMMLEEGLADISIDE